MKKEAATNPGAIAKPVYAPIHMPKSTGVGFMAAVPVSILGFALIWHIWWLAILGLIGGIAVMLYQAWDMDRDEDIPAQTLEAYDRANPGFFNGAQQ